MNEFITQDGTRFHYTCSGTGIPLLLMHGFTEDGRVWKDCLSVLEKKFKVLIPFLPTHQSSAFSEIFKTNPTIDLLGGYLHELSLQIFGTTPFHFIGHSMGGYIGLSMAATYPQQLQTLGLFHSTAWADSEEKKMSRQKSIDFIQQNGAALFLKQSIPGLFADKYKTEHADQINALVEQYSDQTIENLCLYLKAMSNRADKTQLLRSTMLPILFIVGKYDMAVPYQQSLEQIHLPKTTSSLILENSGHMGMLEEPALSIPFLEQFLLRHSVTS